MTTKISYLRDPKTHTRVLTLVSRVVGDKVEYGFSINRPPKRVVGEYGVFREPGDQFTKFRGRQIAEGRMKAEPMVADLVGRTPDVAILETLRDASDNSLVRRIAKFRLDMISLIESLKEVGV